MRRGLRAVLFACAVWGASSVRDGWRGAETISCWGTPPPSGCVARPGGAEWAEMEMRARGGGVGCMGLRGGGRKVDKTKIDKEEYAFASRAVLPKEVEKNLRRHWMRKPKRYLVECGGIKKYVNTTTLLQVQKDRDRLEQLHLYSLPMRLLDLGRAGLRWVRAVPGLIWDANFAKRRMPNPGPYDKFRGDWLLDDEPERELSKAETKAIAFCEELFELENGYEIAALTKPTMVARAIQSADPQERGMLAMTDSDKEGQTGGNHGGNLVVAGQTSTMTKREIQSRGLLVSAGQPAGNMPHVGSHTYGEIAARGFANVLHHVQPQSNDTFVDLGSGTGKAVIAAASLYPLQKAYGIEYVTPLHEAAQRLLLRFESLAASSLPLYRDGTNPDVALHQGDLHKFDVSDATIMFAACTCWSDTTMRHLTKACEGMKVGSRVISMTQSPDLDMTRWVLVKKMREWYGKGKLTWWIYKKVN